MSRRIFPLVASLLFLFCLGLQFTDGNTDGSFRTGQSLNTTDVLASAEGRFALSFIPGEAQTYYLGVYRKIPHYDLIWVANREHPLSVSAALTFSPDGNLVASDGRSSLKLTNTPAANDSYAKILDTGNLILTNMASDVLWQSFDYPTNSLLPGMKLKDAKTGWSLVSFKSDSNPSSGPFSLHLGSRKELILMEGSETYWSSPLVGDLAAIFVIDGEYVTWRGNYTNIIGKVMLDVGGNLVPRTWKQDEQLWDSKYLTKCAAFPPCGAFSICNETADSTCDCLPGFERGVDGCERKTALQCSNFSNVQEDWFLRISKVILPRNPLRLPVGKASECRSACLSNCSCTGYAYDQEHRCLVWDGPFLNLKQVSIDYMRQTDFYLKLAPPDFTKETKSWDGTIKNPGFKNIKVLWEIITPTASMAVIMFGLVCYLVRRKQRKGVVHHSREDLLLLDLGMTQKADNSKPRDGRKREVQMPLFSFASICTATNNFSIVNKLGEGGFGPVYKGTLLKGDEVAIKRLSKRSGQGWEELKNEAMLIAKLQHKNLVKLLGCCIEQDEKMLVYEYMPNKSLDFFLFDSKKCKILNWGTRVQIIEGIAQGLTYLHQYSRLRIIHRDLKPSNILLDVKMNPKISDFGMAIMFGENQLQANASRIAGTYGYMSPEYALEGIFSIKSDVYSFGILLLEIVSGRKSTSLYQTNYLHLIGYAWELWTSDKGVDLVDPTLDDISSMNMVLRYVNIALLCVQESAKDRPTMSDVVTMLSTENVALPYPKEPAFFNVRSMVKANPIHNNRIEICSVNSTTISIMEGR